MSDIVAKNLLLNKSCWYCEHSDDPELNSNDIICTLHKKVMLDSDICKDFIEHKLWEEMRKREMNIDV